MTLVEYNELIDMLNRGHEFEFEYKGNVLISVIILLSSFIS